MKQLKIPFLLSIVMLLTFTGCKVAFVPASSAQAIANVHQLQMDISSLYDGYIAADDKSYDDTKYADVTSDIDNLVAFQNTRSKSKNFLRQAVLVQNAFNEYKGEHKADGASNDQKLKVYKKYLLDQVKPLEVSELSLK